MGGSITSIKRINNKIFSRQLSEKFNWNVCKGAILENIYKAYDYYKEHFHDEIVVIKSAVGASGSGLYIIENEKQFNRIIKRADSLIYGNKCILEKYYQNKIDLNYQIIISEKGDITLFSIKQQIVKNTKYYGSEQSRQINEHLKNQLSIYGMDIGKSLFADGYWGIASVDAMIVDDKIIPVLEINGRMSLSTYTSFMISSSEYCYNTTKYYDYYISNESPIDKLTQLIQYAESNNQYNIKTIIYAYSYDPHTSLNKKHKFRLFVTYLGNNKAILDNKVSLFENTMRNMML